LNYINTSIMKRIITLFVLLTTTFLYSQSSGITYQAVLYNPSGEILPGNNNANAVLSNKDICLRFSITDAQTSLEYQETQKVKTDEFGMVNLLIGSGSQVGGYATNFSAIVWNSSSKKLQVEIDVTGTCANFIEVSKQDFSAVPFAYASKTAENVTGIVPITNGGTGSSTVSGAKTNLGLNNVDNTSDLNKPISLATQTALNGKENTANKSNNTSLGTSDVLFPTQNAVKTYVDNQITTTTIADATTTIKGKIKLAGDLGGTADMPTVPGLVAKENTANKSTNTALGTSDVLFPTQNAVKTYVDNQVSSGVVDASSSIKGKIQLAGDLGGTADVPTVPGLANKENTIASGTTSQYFRGDKTWQTLDKTAVGLSNLDNTSDADKPVSNATQITLNTKENTANKSAVTTLGTSDALYPTQNAVKTYVDTQINSNATPDATSTATGKIQLAGDLAGIGSLATNPVITNGAITTIKLADASVTNAKIGETIPVAKGGTGATSLTGYLKGNGTSAFTSVSSIPVAHVDGAVRKVNGVVPDTDGNVAVIIGRVFTGSMVNPNDATSIQNASPAKKSSDIYVVADGSNPNNGRTFIYDGTNWLEVATNLSTTDTRYVNVAGDTMEGNLTVPTGIKLILTDSPTNDTDAANKAYVDGLVTSSATPDATTSVRGKIKLAGDLGGTADAPTVPALLDKLSGNGTNNYVPKFSAAKTLTDSSIFDNGNVGIGTASPANTLEIKQGTAGNSGLRFTNLNSSSAATTSASKVLSLNSSGDVILTNVPGTQNIVDFSVNADPNTLGTTFNPNTPSDPSVVYQSTIDNSMWTYNGATSAYVTYTAPASTAWNLANTTNDAGSNKNSGIWRSGGIIAGGSSTSKVYGNLTSVGGSNFSGVPSFGTASIGLISNPSVGTNGWSGSGFLFSNSTTGSNAFSMVYNGDKAYFGQLSPSNSVTGFGTWSNVGLALGSNLDAKSRLDVFGGAAIGAYAGVNTAPSNGLIVSGNVGIGISSPATFLHVQGPTAVQAVNASASMFRMSRPSQGGVKWDNIAQFNLGTHYDSGNAVDAKSRLDLALTNGADNTTLTTTMTWLANGNIGIGTTAPTSLLHLVTPSTARMLFEATDSAAGQASIDLKVGGTNQWWRMIGQGSSNGGRFDIWNQNLNSNALSILPTNNNVGIGTLSPTAQFEVAASTGLGVTIKRYGNTTLTGANLILQKTYGTSATSHGAGIVNGDYVGRILFSASNGTSYLTNGTDIVGYASGTQSTSNNGGGIFFRTVPQNSIAQSVERMRIDHNGNIGIGDFSATAPAAQLHTTGSVRLAGAGTPGAGKVLTSDATGNATWQPVNFATAVANQTADFTLTAADSGSVIVVNSASPVTVTVPSTFSAGFYCQIIQSGAGQVNVVGSGGITITSALGNKSRAMGSSIGIMVTNSTTAFLSGDTAF